MPSSFTAFLLVVISFLTGCATETGLYDTASIYDTAHVWEASAKSTSSGGFTYPLSSMSSWTNGNYGACGSYYFSNRCHNGVDLTASRGTSVYAIAAGTVLYVSGTQNGICSSGWGYDWASGSGAKTCNMAILVQHYDDDGTPFVVLYGHLKYGTTYSAGSTVSPDKALGTIGDWYYCSSYTSTSSCTTWTNGTDHLHLGIFPGTSYPSSGMGATTCSTSQAASTSFPSSCSSNGATAPGTYMNTSGRSWVAPPNAPSLSSPSSGASVTSPVSLAWTNGSGTYRSHVMVCTNSSLTSGCFDPDGGMDGMETTGTGARRSTSYSATLSTKGKYYWAVRGIAYNDYNGWGSYSSVRYFTVK